MSPCRGHLSGGLIRSGTSPLCHVAVRSTDYRGGVSSKTRHFGVAPDWEPALPPTLLLPAGRARCRPNLAGHDRRRHRPRRPDHRRAPHLARSASTATARRRSTRRDARWAICSATRFASAWRDDVLAAGEGIETMLSLRCVLPTLPMAAALSANHLSAMLLPERLASALYRPRRRCRRRCACKWLWRNAQHPPASKRSHCRLGWATSTRICTSSASMPSGQPCGFSSYRRTSTASCCRRPRVGIGAIVLASASTARSRRPMPERRDHGLLEGDRTAGGPGRQWLDRLFSAGPRFGPLHREAK